MTEEGMSYGVLFQGMRFKNINDLIRVSPALSPRLLVGCAYQACGSAGTPRC